MFVFIFCQNVEYHQNWTKEYPKIKLVTNSLETLNKHFESYNLINKFENLEIKAAYHFTDDDKIRNYFVLSFVIDLCTTKGDMNLIEALDDFKIFAMQYINDNYK